MAFSVKSSVRGVETFHCNNSKPMFMFPNDVIWFQADGDELEMVRQQFANIPITKGSICSWTGELAGFVFRNLTCPVYQPAGVL